MVTRAIFATGLMLTVTATAQAQGFAQGFLDAQRLSLQNQLREQQLRQLQQNPYAAVPAIQFHNYTFNGRSLTCMTDTRIGTTDCW